MTIAQPHTLRNSIPTSIAWLADGLGTRADYHVIMHANGRVVEYGLGEILAEFIVESERLKNRGGTPPAAATVQVAYLDYGSQSGSVS